MVCKNKWAELAKELEKLTQVAPESLDGAARCVKCSRPLLKSGQCVLGHAQTARQQQRAYPEVLEGVLCYVRDMVDPRKLGAAEQAQMEAIQSWVYVVGQERGQRPETFSQGVAAVRQVLDLVRGQATPDPRLRAGELFLNLTSAPAGDSVDFPRELALLRATDWLVFTEWGEASRKAQCACCGGSIDKGDRVLDYVSGFYQGHDKKKRTCATCGTELCRRMAGRYQALAGPRGGLEEDTSVPVAAAPAGRTLAEVVQGVVSDLEESNLWEQPSRGELRVTWNLDQENTEIFWERLAEGVVQGISGTGGLTLGYDVSTDRDGDSVVSIYVERQPAAVGPQVREVLVEDVCRWREQWTEAEVQAEVEGLWERVQQRLPQAVARLSGSAEGPLSADLQAARQRGVDLEGALRGLLQYYEGAVLTQWTEGGMGDTEYQEAQAQLRRAQELLAGTPPRHAG